MKLVFDLFIATVWHLFFHIDVALIKENSYCLAPEDNCLLTILINVAFLGIKMCNCNINVEFTIQWQYQLQKTQTFTTSFMCQLWAFRGVGVHLTIKLVFLLPALWVCSSLILCNIDVLHIGIANLTFLLYSAQWHIVLMGMHKCCIRTCCQIIKISQVKITDA